MDLVVKHDQREIEVRLERTSSGYLVTLDGVVHPVDVAHLGAHRMPGVGGVGHYSLLLENRQHEVAVRTGKNGAYRVVTAEGAGDVEVLDPLEHLARKSHGAGAGGAAQATAYMPGRVTKILVAEGDEVEAGQGILVLEAMKMENEIQAESAGVVKRLLVEEGQAVEGGDPLFEIGPAE